MCVCNSFQTAPNHPKAFPSTGPHAARTQTDKPKELKDLGQRAPCRARQQQGQELLSCTGSTDRKVRGPTRVTLLPLPCNIPGNKIYCDFSACYIMNGRKKWNPNAEGFFQGKIKKKPNNQIARNCKPLPPGKQTLWLALL